MTFSGFTSPWTTPCAWAAASASARCAPSLFAQIDLTAPDQFAQATPRDKLHGDENVLALLSYFVDSGNAWMVQSRSRSSLREDTRSPVGVAGELFGQEFQCHRSLQLFVTGTINYAHPPSAKLSLNAVVGNSLTDHSEAPP